MRDLNTQSVSDYITESFQSKENPRLSELVSGLTSCLHDFVREKDLTREEWLSLVNFLCAVGEKTTPARNEFMLLSDVLGVTSLVDLLSAKKNPGNTASSPLGPFYLPNAPMRKNGDFICREDEPGTPMLFRGKVVDDKGNPLPGALIDVWQNADSGLYSNEDESQNDMNNRGRVFSDEAGCFALNSVRPQPYSIPMDGPVGDVMRRFGRSPWRTAHIHVIVRAAGYQQVTTELFFSDCPYLDVDAVAGVRPDLVVEPVYENTSRGRTLIYDYQFHLGK